MSKRLWVLTTFSILATAAAAAGDCAFFSKEILTSKVRSIDVTLEVARTVEEHRHGMMHRAELAPNHGMLFVLQEPRPIALWMKNTPMDLDAAFLDEDGCIFQIVQMKRNTLDLHRSVAPPAYALEITHGWFASHGISKGACFQNLPNPQTK